MGGAASKPARQFPKTVKPSRTGARTPGPQHTADSQRPPLPRASETKDEAIERDSKDPQLLANISRLGPVAVDHHMRTVRLTADSTNQTFQTRLQSEVEARSSRQTHNHLLPSSLFDLLNERKAVTRPADIENLAKRYGIDAARLESLARFVTPPSIREETTTKTVGEDGIEKVTMTAVWVDPTARSDVRNAGQ
ncbi:hypothetical protein CERSUDRAFT_113766 [Gelatoporia subvermispora B]|uniref:Uncharacterized protein n=1 Tax=Ceriporiopsis subvermispora (strain B) TaxID=914234 RepID=M2RJD9_CERS8|nr:hypothetical protein CERSUDRAFT_113766 [Gelatoporia subvermispora B]